MTELANCAAYPAGLRPGQTPPLPGYVASGRKQAPPRRADSADRSWCRFFLRLRPILIGSQPTARRGELAIYFSLCMLRPAMRELHDIVASLLDRDGSCRDLNFETPTWTGVRDLIGSLESPFGEVSGTDQEGGCHCYSLSRGRLGCDPGSWACPLALQRWCRAGQETSGIRLFRGGRISLCGADLLPR